jgi:ABC-type transporter Mla MlaB component
LLAALADRKPLCLDLRDSGPWDFAGIQLLISCVQTGHHHNQRVRLLRIPKGCAEIAERSGLADWLNSVAE